MPAPEIRGEGALAITSPSAAELRARSTGHLFMVAAAMACGLMGAFGAVGFRVMIATVQAAFFEGATGLTALARQGFLSTVPDPLGAALLLPWWARLLIPAAGGLVVGPVIWFFAREAKGHGVPEVIAAVALRGGVIRPRVVAVKALASAFSIGSGGSVGREGPIVQMGAAAASTLGQLLKVSASQLRVLVGCGSAAGIAATFNAPIAGALFAAEVVVGNFAVAQLTPIVISSVVATVVSRAFLGNSPAFPVPPYELVSPFELLPYMVLGVVAGFVALAFILLLYATEDAFDRMRLPEWSKPAIGGLMVGAIGIWLPNVFGVGYSSIEPMLTGSLAVALLGALVVAKLVATSLTIGSGGSGGIFAPSLFLGAATGGFLGTFVHLWFPESTASSGAYALVTMGAVVAAATHAPLSAMIIIFELTQTINIIPPLMAACMMSTLVATFLLRDSIYTLKLRRRGIDIYEEEETNVLRALFVRDIIDREPETLRAGAGLEEVLEHMLESERTEFFVIDDQEHLLGTIHLRQLARSLAQKDLLRHVVVAGDLMEAFHGAATEDDALDVVAYMFSRSAAEEIPIVSPSDPFELVGTVHKRDLMQAYNEEAMRRDLAGQVGSNVLVAARGAQVELGGGYVLQEIQPPPRFFGRTIRECDIAREWGVQVVLIRKRAPEDGSGPSVHVATGDAVISEGDRIVVAGIKAKVEALDVI